QAVAAHDARTQGLDLDWASEVTVTSGATEALAAAFFGLIQPGDEVVVFQPFYDSYLPIIRRAGGVLPEADLALLAEFCVARDVIAICDEVWEQVIFGNAVHRPLIAFPGMRGRTVKIGSAGKMFGLTGWKVGFLCGAPELTHTLARAHQFLTFTTPPNLQAAVAWGLENSGDWFSTMPRGLERSRDRLSDGLKRQGFAV